MGWLRGEGRKKFESSLETEVEIKDRMASTVLEYVPTTFAPQDETSLRAAEFVNNLPSRSIAHAKWIKPIEKHSPNQQLAFLFMDFRDEAAAEKVLRNGMVLEKKIVWPKKKLPEPRLCFKCQKIGMKHRAAECTQEYNTCGHCGGCHRSNLCPRDTNQAVHCVNCDQRDHGPANQNCPRYIEV
ncbi:hypothetical protein CPB83DRAFT_778369 [Crepidotus variabilis]|uniref:Uncharacterized protein n=1 Tax=Crepidotus variabilis TaxID=179855 RepID=A0A9P6E352_9AGAR|nr:hypothetical protein CPB83DRAFT_778369 [Crepidotus variabilis]